ncbi:TonB-dependent receptor [Brevundimonas bacteroides]|uniref:TonB-dependent receptor n=1 Tax=Brevundimonas bacteroides TaxID=74311 RepID=UPI0004955570|nr:TonB-dependent receptor [Brevundimonas bacteroides]
MSHTHGVIRTRSVILAGVAFAALASAAAPASAQQAASGDPEASAVEDIVVTARRREEALQDVPIAVTAFTEESLQNQQIEDLSDVARYTPGVQLQQAFGRDGDRPVIRGASNILTGDGKVGIFLDGVPWFGDFSTLDLDLAQRVEVVRGPQSAVYGRGTLSGAINVVTRRPGDDYTGRMNFTVGTDQRLDISGVISGPITENLGGMFGFSSNEVEGQYQNTVGLRERLGSQETRGFYGGLFFEAGDIDASVRYFRNDDRDSHFPISLLPAAANNCFLTTRPYYCGEIPVPTSYALNTDQILVPGIVREAERWVADVNWDIAGSGYVLSYLGGKNDVYESSGYDGSYDARDFFVLGTGCPFIPIANRFCARSAFYDTAASDRSTETHELRISSPGDNRFRWSLGYYTAEDELTPLAKYLEVTETGFDVLGAINLVETEAWFASADFDLTDALTLTLEVRHQEDQITSTNQTYIASQYFGPEVFARVRSPNPNAVVGTPGTRNTSFDATLPRVTLTWEPSSDLTLYAQYAQGNSPGGFNDLAAPVTTYEEETLTNYEIGAKTRLFGFDYLNASLFYNVYEDQVLTNTFVALTAIQSYRANIGETELKGLELEGGYSLTDNIRARFTYSYIDAEITEGVDGDQAVLLLGRTCLLGTANNLDGPGCRAAGDISGKEPPLVSRHLGSAGIRWDGDTMDNGWNLFASADLTYRGEFFEQVHNNITIPASTRVDLQVGVQNDHLRLSIWGKNVGDDDAPVGVLRYVDFIAPNGPAGVRPRAFGVTPGELSSYGVTLSARF